MALRAPLSAIDQVCPARTVPASVTVADEKVGAVPTEPAASTADFSTPAAWLAWCVRLNQKPAASWICNCPAVAPGLVRL